jgi:hypothetical protein
VHFPYFVIDQVINYRYHVASKRFTKLSTRGNITELSTCWPNINDIFMEIRLFCREKTADKATCPGSETHWGHVDLSPSRMIKNVTEYKCGDIRPIETFLTLLHFLKLFILWTLLSVVILFYLQLQKHYCMSDILIIVVVNFSHTMRK